MLAIKTENLTKKYKDFTALDNLNLEIKQGEVYGFIGKNGAGKTTTINLILSLIKSNSGNIFINEKQVAFQDQDYKKYIGYVPDVPTFPNYMTSKEYLKYTCEMYKMDPKKMDKQIEEVLNFVDLHRETKRVGGFSRGMKQRLAIAQALVHDPEIIIMDEPTSALDPIGRNEVMNIIIKLKGKKTIFYSTHILDDVERVCDRIGLLNEGKLVLEDTVENIVGMFMSNEVYIETMESTEEVVEFLKSKKVKNKLFFNEKGIKCQLEAETTANDILKLLVDSNYNIKEFKQIRASLEDVFIKVTSEKTT